MNVTPLLHISTYILALLASSWALGDSRWQLEGEWMHPYGAGFTLTIATLLALRLTHMADL